MKYVLFSLLLGLGLCVGCAPAGDADKSDNLTQVESPETTTAVSVVKIDVPGIT